MQERLISHDGRTYKYVAKESKYYLRVASKQYNASGPGWSWQALSTERVPEQVKKQK